MEIGQSLLSIAASPILTKNYFPRILVILKILSRKHVPNQQTFSRHIYYTLILTQKQNIPIFSQMGENS